MGAEIASKDLPGGRTAVVEPLLFGRARVSVGPTGAMWFESSW